MSSVGVDACSGGWFAAIIDGEGLHTKRYEEFRTLWADHDACDRLLVDIPIGIPEEALRDCDVEAKTHLGCRGSSVFYTPSRAVVDNYGTIGYDEANQRNKDRVDRGISQQAWNIVPAIAEMDEFLQSHGDLAGRRIRESHPELCFYAFNDGNPIAYSKHSDRGRETRRTVLEATVLDGVDAAYDQAMEENYRKDVGRDDIWDAFVLAAAAQRGQFVSLPEGEDQTDSMALPMEIVYPDLGFPP